MSQFLNIEDHKIFAKTLSTPYTFAESTSRNQTQTITILNLSQVNSVTVDNGNVSYSVSGDKLTLNLSNGTGKEIQTGGSYTPEDRKTVTDKRSTEAGGSASTLPTSLSYNNGGYKGTLSKSGAATVTSGSYTAEDSKTVTDKRSTEAGGSASTLPTSLSYNSGGYKGTLSKSGAATVTSGSYTAEKTKVITDTNSDYVVFNIKDPSLLPTDPKFPDHTKTVTDSEGYSGTLTITKYAHGGGVWICWYTGILKKPAVDTRVWTQNYSGTVTKPAVDTRVWTQNYSGTVTKPAVDTRTYETRYQYKVTVSYLSYAGTTPTLAPNDGVTLNGTTQYFKVPRSAKYELSKNISIGVMFKPTSSSITSRQNLVSDTESGGIAITLSQSYARTYVYIGGTYQTVDIPINLIKLNNWNHILMTYNGSSINMYLNGDYVSSKEVSGSITYPPNFNWIVGAEQDGSNFLYHFKGQIQNVSLWNKILSQTEIINASKGTYTSSGLVGGWTFDNIANGTVYDLTANKNHVTSSGYSPLNILSSSNVDDMSATLNWTGVTGAQSYILKKDGQIVYQGGNRSLSTDDLISETNYLFSVSPVSTNGESVASEKTVTTSKGSLSIESFPSNINLPNLGLNGTNQTIYGSIGQKIVVKDTRRTRDGWRLKVKASNFLSADGKRTFPANSIKIKPITSISQTKGLKKDLPIKTSATQQVDNGNGAVLVSADPTKTGYGVYEITLPTNAIEIQVNPKYAYAKSDKTALAYKTDLTWLLESGN
ncbi:LamG-like jellyroll fold domain-containing protein [Heyndrickxia sporothermodurans]|uniref:LamG-like jellyroll fold domain-containing protein n=1 Tax=Heyndrickxia sporothermodurans TaxID=46224 RepID=UPI0013660B89|nr:LamG-like jellyroll fold domain-containing protein [Heyndrickxia sporothermodurans]